MGSLEVEVKVDSSTSYFPRPLDPYESLPPVSESEFDVVVVGAGPAGEVIAGRTAEAGLKTAIVEPHLIGGECSFYACMPSKGLLRPGEVLAEIKRIPGAAEAVTGKLDAQAVLDRRDEIIHDLDDSGQLPWLESRDIALYRGPGRLDGERRVVVGEDVLTARKAVVIATGSRASVPPIEGLAEAEPWTNREVTTAKELPGSLAILGGGVVGVEMAQAYNSLGVQVTLIEASDRILPREEDFAGTEVADALRERGVDIHEAVHATSVKAADGGVTVELDKGGPVHADVLLAALGRTPNTDDIGLDSVGLEPGGHIEVDDHMRVGDRDWLYAIGDVNGRVLLTHMGKYQARVAAHQIIGDDDYPASHDGGTSPRVIFTDPQVAAVGYTASGAQAAGMEVKVFDVGTSANAGGSFYGRNATGTSRIVVDAARDVIVGATFTGAEVQDFLHAATIAVVAEVPLSKLRHAVPSFPTRSEVWLNLLEDWGI
jgi:pyruvate/2-oxoglutarate dehydrogenase complex dihydrolipoamide dehydrogenase (E3) component